MTLTLFFFAVLFAYLGYQAADSRVVRPPSPRQLRRAEEAKQKEAAEHAAFIARYSVVGSVSDLTTEAGRIAAAKFFSEPLDDNADRPLMIELTAQEYDAALEARAHTIFPDSAELRAQWIAAQNAYLPHQ
jgi:hypothetical protein